MLEIVYFVEYDRALSSMKIYFSLKLLVLFAHTNIEFYLVFSFIKLYAVVIAASLFAY